MAKKQDEIKKAIGGIPLGDQEPEPEAKDETPYTVLSVGLTGEQLDAINEIADELQQPRHAIMKYAVVDFIRRYKAGERPETKTVIKLDTGI